MAAAATGALSAASAAERSYPTSEVRGSCRECQKNIYFCFIDYAKAFDCVDHNKVWNILKDMGYQTT